MLDLFIIPKQIKTPQHQSHGVFDNIIITYYFNPHDNETKYQPKYAWGLPKQCGWGFSVEGGRADIMKPLKSKPCDRMTRGLTNREYDPNATIDILASKEESKQICSFLLVNVHFYETSRAFLGEKVSEIENAGNIPKNPGFLWLSRTQGPKQE